MAESLDPASTRIAELTSEVRIFLFAEVRDFTSFSQERVRAGGGRVLDLAGDGAFAVFVSPRQAIQTAVDLQERFRRVIERERRLPLALRVGIESGEAIPLRGKYMGSVVILAARICNLTAPGELLIGETIYRLVRKMAGLRFLDRGDAQVKGFADPVRIVQVVREDDIAGATSLSSSAGADCETLSDSSNPG